MEKRAYDRWNLNNIKAMVRVAYEAGVLQAQKTPGHCTYYAQGYRCAVGQILTGEEIDELAANCWLDHPIDDIEPWLKEKGCTEEAVELLYKLQQAHDNWSLDRTSKNQFLKLLEFEKVEVE